MRVLALDTATPATTVALLNADDGTARERRDDPPAGERPRHTARLLELIAELMAAAEIDWDAVDRIAVGVGPGTFTGLRIGIASARAVARARGLSLTGVSTLQSLAAGAAGEAGAGGPAGGAAGAAAGGDDCVLAVLDARRREVFAAGWTAADAGRPGAAPLLAPRALSPQRLADELAASGRRWLAVGDGAVAFREALERSGARVPEAGSGLHRVSAVEHCRLALGLSAGPPDRVSPEYLRLPDAELNLRAATGQR